MSRILILLIGIVILNGCAQSTSFVGPSYTLAKSGSIMQAGNSVAMSYGFKKTLNQIDTNTMMLDGVNIIFFHTGSIPYFP